MGKILTFLRSVTAGVVVKSCLSSACLLTCASGFSAESPNAKETMPVSKNWQEVKSACGSCKMQFPSAPEHISEKMKLDEEGFDLQYDAYISSADSKTIFMLLVAQYPEFVDEQFAHMSLEAFLNGILTHNPSNQLLFADLVLVDGHEALDFFIRTGAVYFKGRALMVKNQLYLMAVECAVQDYNETHYNTFVNSFFLSKP